jgi:hypothetical protein
MATKEESHDALDAVVNAVEAEFLEADGGKVDQLRSAAATAHMVIDQLFDRADVRAAEGAQE